MDAKRLIIKFLQDWNKLPWEESHKIWYVMTALRGPDSADDKLKTYTTGKIRSLLCILTKTKARNWCIGQTYPIHDDDVNKEIENIRDTIKKVYDDYGRAHFNGHISDAIATLESWFHEEKKFK